MAIVEYKCDVCKRTVQIPRNIHGLERIHRCTITQGCRGKMFQNKLFQDYQRSTLPESVAGLNNWFPRKVLHDHEQPIKRTEWSINHDMGSNPVVHVYIDPIEGDELIELNFDEFVVEIVDKYNLIIKFDIPQSGVAQLVGQQSDPVLLKGQPIVTETEEVTNRQISNNGEFTIAINVVEFNNQTQLNVRTLVSYDNSVDTVIEEQEYFYTADSPSINSPWSDVSRVVYKGKMFRILSFNGIVADMESGIIPNGFEFRIDQVGLPPTQVSEPIVYEDVSPVSILIMISNSPHENIDKVYTHVIDVGSINQLTETSPIYFDNGEFFVDESALTQVFPKIKILS